jgi:hypothetical protein
VLGVIIQRNIRRKIKHYEYADAGARPQADRSPDQRRRHHPARERPSTIRLVGLAPRHAPRPARLLLTTAAASARRIRPPTASRPMRHRRLQRDAWWPPRHQHGRRARPGLRSARAPRHPQAAPAGAAPQPGGGPHHRAGRSSRATASRRPGAGALDDDLLRAELDKARATRAQERLDLSAWKTWPSAAPPPRTTSPRRAPPLALAEADLRCWRPGSPTPASAPRSPASSPSAWWSPATSSPRTPTC